MKQAAQDHFPALLKCAALTATVLSVSLIALGSIACGPNKESYTQKNELLLETLPKMPGSSLLEITSSPYYAEHETVLAKTLGYTTSAKYVAPTSATPKDVIDFYVAELKDRWQLREERLPISSGGEILVAHFTKDRASISVNTDEMTVVGNHRFTVGVDHDAKP